MTRNSGKTSWTTLICVSLSSTPPRIAQKGSFISTNTFYYILFTYNGKTDKIKRRAHREVWYGPSANPFRKTRTRAAADAPWTGAEQDIEAAVEGVPYLSEVSQRIPSARSPSEENARQRFIERFSRRNKDELKIEDASAATKLPKHDPFTLRNQLGATIFKHWVRVLLLLTPVGLAVHYTHFNATTDFLVNFFAVLPLTDMFGQGLVELKMWSQDPRMEWIAYAIFGYE